MGPAGESVQETVSDIKELKKQIWGVITAELLLKPHKVITTRFKV